MKPLITNEAAKTVQTTNVPEVDLPRLVRPACSNCGKPASYYACHWEAGAVAICADCHKSHLGEHTNVRSAWPPRWAVEIWKCNKCGDIFDEEKSSWEDLPGDSGERVIACPKCGANFLDDHDALESFYVLPNSFINRPVGNDGDNLNAP